MHVDIIRLHKAEAKRLWRTFGKHHYLDGALHPGATCYGAFIADEPIAFCAVLHFPHPQNKKIKKVHRVVTLPDYQGIGVGTRFLNRIGELYTGQGFDFHLVTSARNLVQALRNSPQWILKRRGRVGAGKNPTAIKGIVHSSDRNTYTFAYRSKRQARSPGDSG
ncbi:GNAT family N-acetyltransferase [Alicyclobacillus sp. ALC3]|uniref:GNAT family N-acetyltransferase n=1 Tax=Alicyclobacillus sp. ALC3 TaxID=2796143 RepID=UPI003FCC5A84